MGQVHDRPMTSMQSLQFIGPGQLRWEDRPAPTLAGDGEALVRPVAASVCDIDRPLLEGWSPWSGPLAFGHEAVAEVLDVGDAVTAVAPGDLVAVTWHISCGVCGPCARGLTAHCAAAPPQAMYGLPVGGDWGGLFDDVVRVPFADAMLTVVPPGVAAADAVSAGDNLSLGREIMATHIAAGRRRILVLGSAAVGITQVAVGSALGVSEVVYVDDDPGRRAVAARLGATAVAGPPDRSMGRFDLVVDASFQPSWLRRAVRMLVPEGVAECLATLDDLVLPGLAMYASGATVRLGRANTGPHVAPTLELLAAGAVRPSEWSQVVAWDEAPSAMAEPSLKPVALRERIT
jgi:threonine dehydrogenase-like Zn-dependent dehydrogenase